MSKQKRIIVSKDLFSRQVAWMSDAHLTALYAEDLSAPSMVGGIYSGKIKRVVAAIGAAFVDLGAGRSALLRLKSREAKLLQAGGRLLLQVIKNPRSNKGAVLSQEIRLPGILVDVWPRKSGVARDSGGKAPNALMSELRAFHQEQDFEVGFKLRTRQNACFSAQDCELIRAEMRALENTWQEVKRRFTETSNPCCLLDAPDLLQQSAQAAIAAGACIMFDREDDYRACQNYLAPNEVELSWSRQGADLFVAEGIDKQIDELSQAKVILDNGLELVIQKSEALTSIDVNAAAASASKSDKSYYQWNCDAALEIARQIKLRGLDGQVIIDFLSLRNAAHWQQVEEALTESLREYQIDAKAKGDFEFGIVLLQVPRNDFSWSQVFERDCLCCNASGSTASASAVYKQVVTELKEAQQTHAVEKYQIDVRSDLLHMVQQCGSKAQQELEATVKAEVQWRPFESNSQTMSQPAEHSPQENWPPERRSPECRPPAYRIRAI